MSKEPAVTILYHADCIDGFGAAYAAWCHFGDQADYRPLHHGQPWKMAEISGHDVFILDFSFPPDVLHDMAGMAHSVTQIDHHVSAYQAWADKLLADENGLFAYRHPTLPLTLAFDLQKSGARLAWEHFQPNRTTPLALLHIEDQDMWRFALHGTRAFCRALRLQPFDFAIWHDIVRQSPDDTAAHYRELLGQGEAIEVFFQKEVQELASSALRMPARLRGEPVDALQSLRHGQPIISAGELAWHAISGTAVNANALFASDLGNALAEQNGTFGMIWQLAGDGEVKVSLRSKGSFDVATLAARYGGGGHRNAAGFRLPAMQFFTEILQIG